MTPRTLWIIILKIFGIYILIQALQLLPQLFTTIIYATVSAQREYSQGESWIYIALAIFEICFFTFTIVVLLFRTERVIEVLKLSDGIKEESLEFNMHRSSILKIAVIIAGIILLIEGLPHLFDQLYAYFQQINSYSGFKDYPQAGWIILDLVKVFMGIFMLTSSRLVVNFIERRRKGNRKESPTTLSE